MLSVLRKCRLMRDTRAISLRQPWAWAVVMGYKDVENRQTRTNFRGRILIHAAQKLDPWGFQYLWELGLHRKLPDELITGALIGSVRITDCVVDQDSPWAFEGEWHWLLSSPREFNTPIPCRGSLGLFRPPVDGRIIGQANRYSVAHRRRSF